MTKELELFTVRDEKEMKKLIKDNKKLIKENEKLIKELNLAKINLDYYLDIIDKLANKASWYDAKYEDEYEKGNAND